MCNELVTGLATYPLLCAEAASKKRVCHVSTWQTSKPHLHLHYKNILKVLSVHLSLTSWLIHSSVRLTSLNTSINSEEVSMSRACSSNIHSACISAFLRSLWETSSSPYSSVGSWLWSSTRCSFSDSSSAVVSSGCSSLCLIIRAACNSDTRKSWRIEREF